MLFMSSITYQRCRVKLRNYMEYENGKVSRVRLQEVHTLEAATLVGHLLEEEKTT